jgi:hypothetical protein
VQVGHLRGRPPFSQSMNLGGRVAHPSRCFQLYPNRKPGPSFAFFLAKGGRARTSPCISRAFHLNRSRIVGARIDPLRGSFRVPGRATAHPSTSLARLWRGGNTRPPWLQKNEGEEGRFPLRRIKPHERIIYLVQGSATAGSDVGFPAGCSAEVPVRARAPGAWKRPFLSSIPGKKPAKIGLPPTPPMCYYHFFNDKICVSIIN